MLVRHGRLRLRPVQWWAATAWCQRTGNWTDKITVPQWVLQEVAWWASPAVLQGLPLATQDTEVTLFTDASNLGWGAQLQGQWSAFLRSSHINVLEMQAVINAVRGFLPHLKSRVVRLMCLHQEWRGHTNLHSHAADDMPAEVVRSQGHQASASPSARSAQRPGRCAVQNRPDSQHRVDVDHGTSTTSVYQVGRTTDRHVCYIRQQTTDQVCIAISGHQGRMDRCDVHYLGQQEGPPVCVPAIQLGPSGSAEDLPVSWGANDFGSSQARNLGLWSNDSTSIGIEP